VLLGVIETARISINLKIVLNMHAGRGRDECVLVGACERDESGGKGTCHVNRVAKEISPTCAALQQGSVGLSESYMFVNAAYLATMIFAFTLPGLVLANDNGASTQISKQSLKAADIVVPISIENGEIIVHVIVNGPGPFPMIFDTGSPEAVTPETATKLGLSAEGGTAVQGSGEGKFPASLTRIENLRLGAAELSDVAALILPLPRFFTDRGSHRPIAGLLASELLKRFAVRLDYDDRMLTLVPTPDFQYHGKGKRLPLFFSNRIPLVPAVADGIAGMFEIDTGSSDAIVLQRTFVDQHGFVARHPSGIRMKAGGADGIFETIVARLDRFSIDNAEIKRPVVEFPSNSKADPPVPGVDGSIGYEILRQFIITFDYSRRELWFEHAAAFGKKTTEWKTGFQAVKADGPDFRVVNVLPNSPAAAAGINVGDVIAEVEGLPATSVGQAQFNALMKRADGTVIRLRIIRDGVAQSLTLTLQELFP
jgi:predicted aspartyl protease